MAGAGLAGYLAERWGWRAGFFVLGGSGLVLAGAARGYLADRPRGVAVAAARPPALAAFRYLGRVPSFHLMMLKQLLSELATWVLLAWLPLFLLESFHLRLGEAGLVGTLMLAGALVLGMAAGGWVSDAVGRGRPGWRMLLLALYYAAAAPFPLVFLLHPSFPAVAAAVSVCSIIRGMATAAERPLLCEFIPAEFRSTVFGFYNAIANVGGAVGMLLTGFFKSALGLHAVFAALSVLFLIAAGELLVGWRRWVRSDIRRAQTYASGVAP